MTLEEKIDCIYDEIEDMQLSAEQAKIYAEGAEHGMLLCYPNQNHTITKLFDKISTERKK